MNIDTHDVLAAASTKWNFLPYQPGLVGGHCIGVDPYYLTYKSSLLKYNPEVILAGRNINDSMGKYIADIVINELQIKNKDLSDIVITILGITFKENVSDIRNTKVIDMNELKNNIDKSLETASMDDYKPHIYLNIILGNFNEEHIHKKIKVINVKLYIKDYNMEFLDSEEIVLEQNIEKDDYFQTDDDYDIISSPELNTYIDTIITEI